MPTALSSNYALGLFFIVLVAVLWSASSVLVQYLYNDQPFLSPFLVTYTGVCLFTLWLPANLVSSALERFCCDRTKQNQQNDVSAEMTVAFTPYQGVSTEDSTLQPIAEAMSSPISADSITDQRHFNSAENNQVDINGVEPFVVFKPEPLPQPIHQPWTHYDHFRTALYIAPVWFAANWAYNMSLQCTTIASSTVLASTGSLFTFVFAVLTRDEPFGWIKLVGVLFGVAGSILTGLNDRSVGNRDGTELMGYNMTLSAFAGTSNNTDTAAAVWGDFLGLLSAVGYGGYAVQTRVLCPHDESLFSMQLILGYIGAVCLVAFSPIAVWQILNGGVAGSHLHLPWTIFGSLVVKGLFDNVLSDYLWLRAVILTSATVATVGLGLTIPLAFACDVLFRGNADVLTPFSIIGALSVLLCFVLVNLGSKDEIATPQVAATSNNMATTSNKTRQYDVLVVDAEDPHTQFAGLTKPVDDITYTSD